jgi:DNA-binding response OmpR family regulator
MDAETLHTYEHTLLIVDDEPLMTELFEKFMSKRGFHVLTAASGAEALEIVSHEKGRIGLVLTDMTMPAMDGLTLAGELGRLAPQVPVMVATGHDADMETTQGLPNVVAVVRKPYKNGVLLEQIREVLSEHQAARR